MFVNKTNIMAYIHRKKDNRNRHLEMKRKERMKIYNSQRWRDMRDWKMVENPLCEMCLKEDRVTPVEEIHHMTSFMSTDDPIKRTNLAFDYGNLMSICKTCHQRIHNPTNKRR